MAGSLPIAIAVPFIPCKSISASHGLTIPFWHAGLDIVIINYNCVVLMIGVIVKVIRVVNNVAPEGAVAIGRGTVWGNPFIMGVDGERERVVAKFRQYAQWRLEREPSWLEPLRGKDLACYCTPSLCHGHVILELMEVSE